MTKRNFIKAIASIILLLFCGSLSSSGQSSPAEKQERIPHTILWKVSGSTLEKPSYLLGIHHTVGMDWLYSFPKIKHVVESSEYLLTELYGDNVDEGLPPEDQLKALSLLTSQEFNTLDSFFLAEVDEGLTNNEVAEAMDVSDLGSAILITLLTPEESDGLAGMDQELFEHFQQQGKPSFRMDNMKDFSFGKRDAVRARETIELFVKAAKIGDNPGWNLADSTGEIGRLTHSYKQISFDYQLDEKDPEEKSAISKQTVKERNQTWIPAIEEKMLKYNCLIAVGAYHLRYETGVIALLRNQGYTVEPVDLGDH